MALINKMLRQVKKRLARLRMRYTRSSALRLWPGNCSSADPLKHEDAVKELTSLRRFIERNAAVDYELTDVIPIVSPHQYDFVGAQAWDNNVFFIPNGTHQLVWIDNEKKVHAKSFIAPNEAMSFRWTGGGIFDGRLWCFPRMSNSILSFDLLSKEARLDDLGQCYEGEHHYGGTMVDGWAYLPPRNSDHILAIDLASKEAHRIGLAPAWLKARFRYCGSVRHPNGMIYFLPETGDRVIEFNPLLESVRFIGESIDATVFDACVDSSGIIFGFSAASKGILRVDPDNETSSMIRTDIGCPGCYGSKMGANGKIYGVPGDGSLFLELDPVTHSVRGLSGVPVLGTAKCAGGAVLKDGSIVCAPAFGKTIFILAPRQKLIIPEALHGRFFTDSY